MFEEKKKLLNENQGFLRKLCNVDDDTSGFSEVEQTRLQLIKDIKSGKLK